MNNMSHWNPISPAWRASDPFEAMNRLMDWEGEQQLFLPLDVIEQDDVYLVRASLPGIDPDALDITFTDNVLTIRGKSEYETEESHDTYLLRERRAGSFVRSLTFPTAVDADHIEATCVNGELTLRVPKAEEARPRRVPISSASGARAPGGRVIENRAAIGHTNGHGYAEGQAQLPVKAEIGSEGWAEGQAQLPAEAEVGSEGWAEGQAQLPAEAEVGSEGWAEGQATQPRG